MLNNHVKRVLEAQDDFRTYESYHLYFVDSDKFKDKVKNCDINCLKALVKILAKIISNGESKVEVLEYTQVILNCFSNISENTSDVEEQLEMNLTLLLALDLNQNSKLVIKTIRQLKVKSELSFYKLITVAIKVFMNNNELVEFYESLVDGLYGEDTRNLYCISILLSGSNSSNDISKHIFEKGLLVSNRRSAENICYFFEQMIKNNVVSVDDERFLSFLENCLKNEDSFCRKQGLYLVKKMINMKLLNEEEIVSWRKLTIIIENLEENQSHLIIPTLDLLKEIKMSTHRWSYIVCELIIKHENSLVANWGIQYILSSGIKVEDDGLMVIILNGLNKTYLYESDDHVPIVDFKLLKQFVQLNFTLLNKNIEFVVHWISVPFYYIIKCVQEALPNIDTALLDKHLLTTLGSQIKAVNKIQVLQIRAAIQIIYSDVLVYLSDLAMYSTEIQLNLIESVLQISNSVTASENLNKCLKNVKPDAIETIVKSSFAFDSKIFMCEKIILNSTCLIDKFFRIIESVDLVSKFKLSLRVLRALSSANDYFLVLYKKQYRKLIEAIDENLDNNWNAEVFQLVAELQHHCNEKLIPSNVETINRISTTIMQNTESADYDAWMLTISSFVSKAENFSNRKVLVEKILKFLSAFDLENSAHRESAGLINHYTDIHYNLLTNGAIINNEKFLNESIAIIERGHSSNLFQLIRVLSLILKKLSHDDKSFFKLMRTITSTLDRIFKEIIILKNNDEFFMCFER